MNLFSQFFHKASIPQLDAAQVSARLSRPGAPFLLDVRQPEEYREGHIAGARLIPLNELASRMGELPPSREIVCVCRSGSRSGVAARQLTAAGLAAANLRGGMLAWKGAGLPLKKGTP